MLCSGRAHVLIIRSWVNGNFNPFSEGSWLLLHMNPRGASLQIAWNSVSQTVIVRLIFVTIKQSKSTLFRYIEIFEFVYTRIHRWNILERCKTNKIFKYYKKLKVNHNRSEQKKLTWIAKLSQFRLVNERQFQNTVYYDNKL